MKTEKKIVSLADIPTITTELKSILPECAVITFTGPLGAGKTTLVRTLLQELGVQGPITSPTFTYLNQYENQQGQTFYHFDCYRLTSLNDFLAAGFDEFLYQPNSWTFIEWPDIVLPLLTHHVCHVAIDYHNSQRSISWYTL